VLFCHSWGVGLVRHDQKRSNSSLGLDFFVSTSFSDFVLPSLDPFHGIAAFDGPELNRPSLTPASSHTADFPSFDALVAGRATVTFTAFRLFRSCVCVEGGSLGTLSR
jgi:hypothetical protein